MIPWSHGNLDIPCKKASEYVLRHKLFRKQVYPLAITLFLQLSQAKAIAMKGVSIIQAWAGEISRGSGSRVMKILDIQNKIPETLKRGLAQDAHDPGNRSEHEEIV